MMVVSAAVASSATYNQAIATIYMRVLLARRPGQDSERPGAGDCRRDPMTSGRSDEIKNGRGGCLSHRSSLPKHSTGCSSSASRWLRIFRLSRQAGALRSSRSRRPRPRSCRCLKPPNWPGSSKNSPNPTPACGPAARPPGEPAAAVVQPAARRPSLQCPEWSSSPVFDYIRQAYLLNSDYLTKVADAPLPIADGRTKARMQFLTRQYVDAMAPSNFAATNPEFIQTAARDPRREHHPGHQEPDRRHGEGRISMTDDSAFEIGRNLATTPGSVIYENPLIHSSSSTRRSPSRSRPRC